MSNALKMAAGTAVAAPLWVDDVMSCHTYTGNGSTQTITNGIDLAGEGGMVWSKKRSSPSYANGLNSLVDTVRGYSKYLYSDLTNGEATATNRVTSFDSNGYSLGSDSSQTINYSGDSFVSWTFRNSDRFFNHASVVKSSGSDATASFTGLGTIGMVAVKRTDSTGSWYVWHRSLTAGKLLYLEQTAAEATLGHITVSGTTVTLVDGVITDGTYIVYAWAHDTEADGIIQCGSYTGGGASQVDVNLGWEPQYVLIKRITDAGFFWALFDSARKMPVGSAPALLLPSYSDAESEGTEYINPSSTGFRTIANNGNTNASGITYIYLAIRRPNKPPTVGTEVYNAIARTGTGAAATVTGVGFAPDLVINRDRTSGIFDTCMVRDRLRGVSPWLRTTATSAEAADSAGILSYNMDGVSLGDDGTWGGTNWNAETYINWFFRRAPGFFDSSCDTGTGANKTESHNLGVAPELVIRKGRSGATQWEVWCASIANTEKLILNSTAAKATDTTAWNSTSPTASLLSIGSGANVNTTSATYVTYIAATLAGLSKIGSYTGNDSSQTIDCGFTTGARFFLVKATSTTGSWWVWDSVRGIVAGTDFGLQLNSTAAETTSADAVDPTSSGIIVNQEATCSINASGVSYMFWAVS